MLQTKLFNFPLLESFDMYDFNTIDEIFETVFGCEMEVHGTVNPSIIPVCGTIEIISDDMEVAQIECDLEGNVIAFDYYCA